MAVIWLNLLALGLLLGLWAQLRDDPTYQAPVGDMKGNHEFAEQIVKGLLRKNRVDYCHLIPNILSYRTEIKAQNGLLSR